MTDEQPDLAPVVDLLTQIRDLIATEWAPGAAGLQRILDKLAAGDEAGFVEALTGGDTWGHMGSLLDVSLSDPEAEGRLVRAQVALADELERRGIATVHVRHHAEPRREWIRRGVV